MWVAVVGSLQNTEGGRFWYPWKANEALRWKRVPERTKGEISARCDMEEINILALNLAHDIVRGQRTVDDARQFYAHTATPFMMNRPAPYVEGLLFQQPTGETADIGATRRC